MTIPGPTDSMVPEVFRVVGRKAETADTATLRLERLDPAPFPFAPGQFNMMAPFGIGEAAISIAGDPTHPGVLVHTVRDVGPVTHALCQLGPGDAVGIRGPYGTGWPVQAAAGRDILILGGGIGLAPLRPAVEFVFANRAEYGSLSIVYGARSPNDLIYVEDLHRWRSRFDVHTEISVDRAGTDWHGHIGFVTSVLDRVARRLDRPVVLTCGPEIMMRAVADEMIAAGSAAEDVFLSFERNMQCGIGLCGHCQYGPDFICRTGPVLPFAKVASRLSVADL